MSEKQAGIVLRAKDRAELERIVADGNTPQKIVKRARIVLMTADGRGVMAIIREVGVSKTTVWRWQEYFVEAGVAGLVQGRSKPPGKKPIADDIKLKVIEKTVKERPANGSHWSVRTMAAEMGISHTSVQRIWNAHELKPHLTRTFKVSNDPDFTKKVKDIVGLYLDPPEKALVLADSEALDLARATLRLGKISIIYSGSGRTMEVCRSSSLSIAARGARRPSERGQQTDPRGPPGRRGCCWPTSQFLFRRFGANDGAAAAAPAALVRSGGGGRAARYGVVDNTIAAFRSTDTVRVGFGRAHRAFGDHLLAQTPTAVVRPMIGRIGCEGS